MFPTDARLLNRAREILVRLAKGAGIKLRQSYGRVGKFALIKHQRYAHAKQFKRANRALKTLRTYLGRVIRDIGRKLGGNVDLLGGIVLERMLARARRVLEQKQLQRGQKVYSLHAPEVECIGKGKAHRPYEFGVKVSVATTLSPARGGQFVTHVKALPGSPYDGHTLKTVIPDMEALIGNIIERLVLDKGYRGHNAPPDYKFRVFISGQKRRVTPKIKRELRRRSAVEPVIGHLKSEHRMGRNYLWHREGDAANAILAAVGYNFRRLIRWLALLLSQILAPDHGSPSSRHRLKSAFFTDDLQTPPNEPQATPWMVRNSVNRIASAAARRGFRTKRRSHRYTVRAVDPLAACASLRQGVMWRIAFSASRKSAPGLRLRLLGLGKN
ncbi:hypothetical protein J2R78_009063 [Bradyrhizobium sp. USDA 4538]|nr:hypothetical protein [Bradyrhizobium sp. USDA 4538]MCP1907337.1 hypothetical protein [Bradyrhizobium sp. USDA 4537]MCP1985123.1 hypothetical protein [Bradyrhizobium sp. USDA 4539]